VPQALAFAQRSVEFADLSGDNRQRITKRTTLADALHQANCQAEAETTFHEAEEMQKEEQPQDPFLYSLQGFQYCDLLLGQGKYQEVESRAIQTLEWAKRFSVLLAIALDNLSLGRARLLQAQEEFTGNYAQAAEFLERAVGELRRVGRLDYLPRALLARATYFRWMRCDDKAKDDLNEVFAIATRGEMRLHLADCHLESARLALATGDRTSARKAWETAQTMIAEMGYHRRDREVAEIARQLGVPSDEPAAN
jgi:tetratricopeptide (TPR) repeat protein